MEKVILLLFIFQSGADLPPIYSNKRIIHKEEGIFEKLSSGLIKIYQHTLSPVQGARCNFEPTCSRFMLRAIKKYGFLKGALLGFDRLQRDHPFAFKYLGKYYGLHLKTKKLFDPPEPYLLEDEIYSTPFILKTR